MNSKDLNHTFPSKLALIMLVAMFGSTAPAGVQSVRLVLVALSSPSSSDVTATLPTSLTEVPTNTGFVVEVWAQTSDSRGLSSVSLDLAFSGPLADVTGISHSTTFGVLTSGTVNNPLGTVDDLSGSHLGPCTDAIGFSPIWARVAILSLQAGADGVFNMQTSPSGSAIYGTAICGVGDVNPADVVQDTVELVIGQGNVPAASTWGLAAMVLVLCNAGTLLLQNRRAIETSG